MCHIATTRPLPAHSAAQPQSSPSVVPAGSATASTPEDVERVSYLSTNGDPRILVRAPMVNAPEAVLGTLNLARSEQTVNMGRVSVEQARAAASQVATGSGTSWMLHQTADGSFQVASIDKSSWAPSTEWAQPYVAAYALTGQSAEAAMTRANADLLRDQTYFSSSSKYIEGIVAPDGRITDAPLIS